MPRSISCSRGLTAGPRRAWPLLCLLLALVAIPGAALSLHVDAAGESWTPLVLQAPGDSLAGEFINAALVDDGIRLGDDPACLTEDPANPRAFGIYSSQVVTTPAAFDAVRVTFDSNVPDSSDLSLEVRVQTGGRWTPWEAVPAPEQAFSLPTRSTAVQYRATLLAGTEGQSPLLAGVRIDGRLAGPQVAEPEYQALATRPTVRLYATREGLVGRVTANGHRIVEKDRFVALPSRKALNLRDGRDYQVELSYKGRKVTAPVWDVGPWNVKDNYWDSPREVFNDLPRFTPQVNAAFFNNHNNGNDQFGRMVLYPAAIDLADGTFMDDLGMRSSDWVDVTFLWVDAAAPPLVPMPAVTPKAGPIPQPIFAQQVTRPAQPTAIPTPTPIPKTWYFAEGSTNKPFETWLLLQNPDPVPANARVTYMLPNGGQKIANYALKPTSRMSVFLNSEVPDTEVSTLIEADRYILAERAMYFGKEGHDTAGAVSPSSLWYFAEGNTAPPFETWILMQNPNTAPASVNLTFFREDGSTTSHRMLIPHVSRASLLVNQVVPDASVGTLIEADRPIVAERAVYKEKGRAGTDTIGATDLSRTWYLAEGVTRGGFDTWLLMLNPNDVPAIAEVTYMKEDGTTVPRKYLVPHRSRVSVYVNKEVPESRVAASIRSDIPIVAERSVFFPNGAGAHNSMAAPALSKVWSLPEGSTAKPFTQNTLLMNPNTSPANVTATFMKEDGTAIVKKLTLNPTTRITLEMNSILPDAAFSTRVESDLPIVVERSMYFADWEGGHNSMGTPR